MATRNSMRKLLWPIKRFVQEAGTKLTKLPYLLMKPHIGTDDWLIKSEIAYGGFVTGVARQKVSPLDRRSAEELRVGGMTGGDRMLHHGYAGTYARYLSPFLDMTTLTIAEFGILKGTGLAIWCDLFPKAHVLGFDIDPEHFESNKFALLQRGAFKENTPKLHDYDQLVDGSRRLADVLCGRTFDIVIDDGLHSLESIVMTWRSVRPHLSSRFAYFIEDHQDLLDKCGAEFSGFDARSYGMITVISAGSPARGNS